MAKPQQPELHRSGLTPADPGSVKVHRQGEEDVSGKGATGPIPEDNLPGHHPDKYPHIHELMIECARAGNRVSDIGHAVQQHVEAYGFTVVREFVGHGIGQRMHEEPQVPNYGEPGRGPRLTEGMVLAIEPMVNAGKPAVKVLGDGWTAITKDGSLSAHFEHTVAVTADGPWILTAREVPVPAR